LEGLMRRYFAGVEGESGIVISTDSYKIGVLRSFTLTGPTRPVVPLSEAGTYEIAKRTVYEVPIKKMVVEWGPLRELFLDAEVDNAPPREVFPWT